MCVCVYVCVCVCVCITGAEGRRKRTHGLLEMDAQKYAEAAISLEGALHSITSAVDLARSTQYSELKEAIDIEESVRGEHANAHIELLQSRGRTLIHRVNAHTAAVASCVLTMSIRVYRGRS